MLVRSTLLVAVALYVCLSSAAEDELDNTSVRRAKDEKVLEQGISALLFDSRKHTKAHRTLPRRQLECVGGSAKGYYWKYPKVVHCVNVGYDGNTVTWRCQADLQDNLVFGTTHVKCEGYDSPDDEYVLVGSCGLEYTLYFSTFTISWVHVTYMSLLTFGMATVFFFARHYAAKMIPDKRFQYREI
mmetsp:Transcript_10333/g.31597  ORF Transcript_10333/g.31597 Transcript_10333/m.31597 type:complete len:186 (-) Transcript_10333:845-1402(-)